MAYPKLSSTLLDWSSASRTLVDLLYIHFQNILEGSEPGIAAPSEALLSLGTTAGDEILWALTASAALSALVGPASQRTTEVILTDRPTGIIVETLPYTLPWGLANSLVPRRLICSPENLAAAVVLERALAILGRPPQSLQPDVVDEIRIILERIRRDSWLSKVLEACSGLKRVDEASLAKRALERIRVGAAPSYFRALVPIFESLAKPARLGATRDRQGLEGLSKLAELIALASVLDAVNLRVTRHAYRQGVFSSANGSVTVCYQHYLKIKGQTCLRPDIMAIGLGEDGSPRIALIEVKSSASEGWDQVYLGLHQLLGYLYLVEHGAKLDCPLELPETPRAARALGVLAIFNPEGSSPPRRFDGCLKALEDRVLLTSVWNVGSIVKGFLHRGGGS